MESVKIPCTVEILTHNSAATLARALESVRDFSEIIVLDGRSTDETAAIARAHGARMLEQDPRFLDGAGRITDFAEVRNQGLEAATQPWFFFLDADEHASPELVEAIRSVVSEEPCAYFVFRKYELDGVRIERASTYPNRNMRFFSRLVAKGFVKPVHERIALVPDACVRDLPQRAPLMVPIERDIAALREKNRRYIAIEIARGKPITFTEWLRSSWKRFLISCLYAWRTVRYYCFGSGAALPFSHELNRHWYHIALSRAELALVRRRR